MIKLYTDGACSGNPGAGGYGYVVILADGGGNDIGGPELWKYDKSFGPVTNNQMEILAAFAGLNKIKTELFLKGEVIRIYSDSKYVVETMKGNWKQKTNLEWWVSLNQVTNDLIKKGAKLEWIWLKGHAGNVWNELADQLAVQGVQASKKYASQNHAVTPYIDFGNKNKQYLFQNNKWVPYGPNLNKEIMING